MDMKTKNIKKKYKKKRKGRKRNRFICCIGGRRVGGLGGWDWLTPTTPRTPNNTHTHTHTREQREPTHPRREFLYITRVCFRYIYVFVYIEHFCGWSLRMSMNPVWVCGCRMCVWGDVSNQNPGTHTRTQSRGIRDARMGPPALFSTLSHSLSLCLSVCPSGAFSFYFFPRSDNTNNNNNNTCMEKIGILQKKDTVRVKERSKKTVAEGSQKKNKKKEREDER